MLFNRFIDFLATVYINQYYIENRMKSYKPLVRINTVKFQMIWGLIIDYLWTITNFVITVEIIKSIITLNFFNQFSLDFLYYTLLYCQDFKLIVNLEI